MIVTAAEIMDALTTSRGNISAAARSLNITRSSIKARIDKDPQLVLHLEDIRESMIDRAEEVILDDVQKGDPTSSRFILSTIGRSRGYITAVGGLGKDGAIEVTIREFGIKETPSDA